MFLWKRMWLSISLILLVVAIFFGGHDNPIDASPAGQPSNAGASSPHSVVARTYYVAPDGDDSAPGAESHPWRTIGKAARTLVAGDTVYIREGTYAEQVIPRHSGSAGQEIIYAAYPGETPVIDGKTVTLPAFSGLITIEDRQYIRIIGLHIQNAGPGENDAGILVDMSSHIVIQDNYTYNTVSSGIGVYSSDHITIDGNEVELANNDGEQENITVAGTDTFQVSNNHVHHGGPGTLGGEGIDAKDGSSNGKIFGNHIHHTQGDDTCLYVDAWDKHTYNIEVYNNHVHDCGSGITLASEAGGLLENVRVYNNVVHDNRSNGLEIGNWGEPLISTRPISGVIFINNTVYHNGYPDWGGGMHNENPDVRQLVVRNNIFSANNTFQILEEAKLEATTLSIDHNLVDGFRNEPGETRGQDFVTGSPKFVDAAQANFSLQPGSPAIDKGAAADAPALDYEGTIRPQDGDRDGTSAYDLGAYEFYPLKLFLPSILAKISYLSERIS